MKPAFRFLPQDIAKNDFIQAAPRNQKQEKIRICKLSCPVKQYSVSSIRLARIIKAIKFHHCIESFSQQLTQTRAPKKYRISCK